MRVRYMTNRKLTLNMIKYAEMIMTKAACYFFVNCIVSVQEWINSWMIASFLCRNEESIKFLIKLRLINMGGFVFQKSTYCFVLLQSTEFVSCRYEMKTGVDYKYDLTTSFWLNLVSDYLLTEQNVLFVYYNSLKM